MKVVTGVASTQYICMKILNETVSEASSTPLIKYLKKKIIVSIWKKKQQQINSKKQRTPYTSNPL